jgi:hypothetical protein
MRCFLLIIASLVLVSTARAQVSVGWGMDCDYNVDTDPQALQTALDDGAGEIRLTHQNAYDGTIEIPQNVSLRGGFADCDAANSDSQFNIRSILDGAGQGDTVVVLRNIEDADVRLELLRIRNGEGDTVNAPGGLEIKGLTGLVTLDQLDLHSNSGASGGGLSLNATGGPDEGALVVTVTNSVVRNNTAFRGGGMYCGAPSSFDLLIDMSGGTTLRGNHATNTGGGLQMHGCQLDYEAGIADAVVGSNLDSEIFGNTSDTSGGGLTLFGTARATLRGTSDQAFDLSGNESNLDDSVSGSGGAAQVSSDAELEIINGYIVSNSTGRYGGGLFANFGGRIVVRRDPGGCTFDAFCSRIVGNRLTRTFPGGGGALAARFGGEISVYNTLFRLNNSDDRGYIGFAESSHEGQAATIRLEGNVLVGNGQLIDDANSSAVRLESGAEGLLAYNTLYRNNNTTTVLSQTGDSSLRVVGNILDEVSNLHQVGADGSAAFECNLVNSLDTIEVPVIDTFEGSPTYVDSSSRNFRLAESDTLAMDVCSAKPYAPGGDMDGGTRGLDRVDVTDLNGPFDLGAYEFDPLQDDRIFADDFQQ